MKTQALTQIRDRRSDKPFFEWLLAVIVAAIVIFVYIEGDAFGATTSSPTGGTEWSVLSQTGGSLAPQNLSMAGGTTELVPFRLGFVPGYTRISQNGPKVRVTTRVGGVTGRHAKSACIRGKLQRARTGSSWKTFRPTNGRVCKDLGGSISSFWIRQKIRAHLSKGFDWRVWVRATYRAGSKAHERTIIRKLF